MMAARLGQQIELTLKEDVKMAPFFGNAIQIGGLVDRSLVGSDGAESVVVAEEKRMLGRSSARAVPIKRANNAIEN
jgi:hypothetical protein